MANTLDQFIADALGKKPVEPEKKAAPNDPFKVLGITPPKAATQVTQPSKYAVEPRVGFGIAPRMGVLRSDLPIGPTKTRQYTPATQPNVLDRNVTDTRPRSAQPTVQPGFSPQAQTTTQAKTTTPGTLEHALRQVDKVLPASQRGAVKSYLWAISHPAGDDVPAIPISSEQIKAAVSLSKKSPHVLESVVSDYKSKFRPTADETTQRYAPTNVNEREYQAKSWEAHRNDVITPEQEAKNFHALTHPGETVATGVQDLASLLTGNDMTQGTAGKVFNVVKGIGGLADYGINPTLAAIRDATTVEYKAFEEQSIKPIVDEAVNLYQSVAPWHVLPKAVGDFQKGDWDQSLIGVGTMGALALGAVHGVKGMRGKLATKLMKEGGLPPAQAVEAAKIVEAKVKASLMPDADVVAMRDNMRGGVDEPVTGAVAEPPVAPIAEAPVVPKSPVAKNQSYRTSKGSTYEVHADGTTTRNKAPRPEHPGEEGPQPRSHRTVYVDADKVNNLAPFQTHGGDIKAVAEFDNGTVAVVTLNPDGSIKGGFKESITPYSTSPEIGKIPVELWDKGQRVHFGNEITEVAPVPVAKAPKGRKVKPVAEERVAEPGAERVSEVDPFIEELKKTHPDTLKGVEANGKPIRPKDLSDADLQIALDHVMKTAQRAYDVEMGAGQEAGYRSAVPPGTHAINDHNLRLLSEEMDDRMIARKRAEKGLPAVEEPKAAVETPIAETPVAKAPKGRKVNPVAEVAPAPAVAPEPVNATTATKPEVPVVEKPVVGETRVPDEAKTTPRLADDGVVPQAEKVAEPDGKAPEQLITEGPGGVETPAIPKQAVSAKTAPTETPKKAAPVVEPPAPKDISPFRARVKARIQELEAAKSNPKRPGGKESGASSIGPEDFELLVYKAIDHVLETASTIKEAVQKFRVENKLSIRQTKELEASVTKIFDEEAKTTTAQAESIRPNGDDVMGLASQFDPVDAPLKKNGTTVDKLAAEGAKLISEGKQSAEAVYKKLEKGESLTPEDLSVAAHRGRQIKNRSNQIVADINSGEMSTIDAIQHQAEISALSEEMGKILDAAENGRKTFHQTGQALQIAFKPDFSRVELMARAKAGNMGEALDPGVKTAFEKRIADLEGANTAIEAARKKLEAQIKKMHEGPQGMSSKNPEVRKKALIEGIMGDLGLGKPKATGTKASRESGAFNIPEGEGNRLTRRMNQLARMKVEEGARSLSEVVAAIQKDIPLLGEEDIMRFLSGEYREASLKADVHKIGIDRAMRQIKERAINRNKTAIVRFVEAGVDGVLSLQRQVQAGGDASFAFIQGLPGLINNPKAWVKAWKAAGEPVRMGQEGADRQMAIIQSDPVYPQAIKAGLKFRSLDGPISMVEETMRGHLLQNIADSKVPGLKHAAEAWLRTDHAFNAFLNDLQFSLWKQNTSGQFKDAARMKDAAMNANILVGKADGGIIEAVGNSPLAGYVAYAPKWAYSTYQNAYMPLLIPFKFKTTGGKVAAGSAWAKQVGALYAPMVINEMLGGKSEKDPRSPNFGQMTLASGRQINLFKKLVGPIVFPMQLIGGAFTTKGKYRPPNQMNNSTKFGQYVTGKASPAAGTAWKLANGERYDPDKEQSVPFNLGKTESQIALAKELFTPLSIQQMIHRKDRDLASTLMDIVGIENKTKKEAVKLAPRKKWRSKK